MYNLPTEPRKIKERIRRYERAFAKELQEFDMISDGSGKRHLLALIDPSLVDNLEEEVVGSYHNTLERLRHASVKLAWN